MNMETVAFYSYKGGVGRTLLVANTAQFLAMSGRRVVALDLDLEAPGLHQKLAGLDALRRADDGVLDGAVNELLGILENEPQTSILRQITIEVDLPSAAGGSLRLIPAGSAPSHSYWASLERLNNALRNRQRGAAGLLETVLELKARIAEEFAPEFLLIDSRTGITELGGLATSILADHVVCLTTTAPESVKGTRVVADALRSAPRLSSQQPPRMSFIITRVTSESRNSTNVKRVIEELGGAAAVLPHDSGIANEEHVYSGWRLGPFAGRDESEDGGQKLLSATLDWIAESFPVHKQAAEISRRRMEAVYRTWVHLTRTSERVRGGTASRRAWPVDQIRERERFGKGGKSRQADIVVYDAPNEHAGAKPLMIIEYVHSEDRDVVARWWLEETRVAVVAILSDNSEHRIYSKRGAWDSRARHSDRWDLPLPHDFEALSDPTDVSVDAMLDSVRHGHSEYLDRLVTEWVRSSAAGLHGGAPWNPKLATKIFDGLARVDDIDLARHVLWATSPDRFARGMWLGDGDEYLDEQVTAELFAPVLWRCPPEASTELMSGRGRPFGPPPGFAAVALLARDILGLRYDPDGTFRVEAQRILDRSGRSSDAEYDERLYSLAPAFRYTEVSFEISSGLPPLATIEPVDENEHPQRKDVDDLVSQLVASNSLVTTGLLGDYLPSRGRVILYNVAISQCASKLSLRARHVGSVTLIHETIHALMHLGRDLDGKMWPEFSLPVASNPLFEPSWFHEALTQYFTYQHIRRLRDSSLLLAFETMSAKQAPPYRVWRRFQDLPIEDARAWFMSVRRGTGSMMLQRGGLFNVMPDER